MPCRAERRGVASGMLATFQNSGMTLSIGIFFSLMIAGLSSTLPSTMFAGLTAHGVSTTVAHQVANLPPVGSLFAAFLGYNPITTLLGPSLHTLSASQAAFLTGHTFFPNLISNPFIDGMHITFVVLGDHDAGRCDGLVAARCEPGAAGGSARDRGAGRDCGAGQLAVSVREVGNTHAACS